MLVAMLDSVLARSSTDLVVRVMVPASLGTACIYHRPGGMHGATGPGRLGASQRPASRLKVSHWGCWGHTPRTVGPRPQVSLRPSLGVKSLGLSWLWPLMRPGGRRSTLLSALVGRRRGYLMSRARLGSSSKSQGKFRSAPTHLTNMRAVYRRQGVTSSSKKECFSLS